MKNRKSWQLAIFWGFPILLTLGILGSVYAAPSELPMNSDIKLVLNGVEQHYTVNGEDVKLLAYGGQSYIPVKWAAQLCNASVMYDDATRSIYLQNTTPAMLVSEPDTKNGNLVVSLSSVPESTVTGVVSTTTVNSSSTLTAYLGSQYDTLLFHFSYTDQWLNVNTQEQESENTKAIVTVTNGETQEVIAVYDTDVDTFPATLPVRGINFINVKTEKVYR